ncbi:cytochrome P450 4c3-like [Spodoptera litura]|uniref:Cytochrome P450 4c3-like n=1 Tax=Spodoptera litura TaxID=69820 RepID=A0A9J7IPR0_SPOLT|nr:cytochrome P450 4c3-like [Spodoptera litura]
MLVVILICIIAVALYIKFRYSRIPLYKFAETWPTYGDLPILGHTHWFIGGPERIFNNIRTLMDAINAEGKTVSSVWIGPSLYMVSFNPDDVQKILETCLEKDYSYKFLQTWLGNGLFVAPIDLWKVHRRLMLPIFHNRIIEDYIEVFGEQGNVLVERLQEQVGKPSFDVYEYITSCMLDIVFETSMGKKMDVQHNPDTPYLRARKTVMSIINMRLFKAWLQPDVLFNLTSHATVQKENIDATHKFTDEVIRDKIADFDEENCKEGRKDILQLLLERKLAFSNIELREHIDSITIAGNDTTALVISYVLLLLGEHQDAQEEVYKELKMIFGDSQRRPTKEDITKMDYLDRVIRETMRLYTVVPIIGRKTQKELKLSTCTVPAGVGCVVVPMVLHLSKKLWGPDADSFNPDRFLPENCANRHPCAYIPFSYGTRNCIGRYFGMLAMKSILANILRSYKVSSQAFDRLKIEILLFPVNGHQITLEKRL